MLQRLLLWLLPVSAFVCVSVPGAAQDGGSLDAGSDEPADAGALLDVAAPVLVAPEAAPPTVIEPVAPGATEVTVRARKSDVERLQASAAAVTVVKLTQAKKRTSDLGEVMSRVPGVSVRRGGSLGANYRVMLNGLQGNQVRIFLDGIPVDILYSQGFVNIPINLLDHIEVYRGVVPIRLGSDALGGALNLVRPEKYLTTAEGSYQVGSFGTQRASASGRYRHDPSGFVLGAEGYFDYAKNNYKIDVEVPDERGRLSPATVERFHDRYQAWGVSGEVGVVDKPWAKKLLVRGFDSEYTKQLQHNIVMTVPYGEVHYREQTVGAVATYQVSLSDRADLDVVASYGRRTTDFVDKSKWVYDWYGNQVRERRQRGEIETPPTDQTVWQDTGFARATSDIALVPGHALVFNVSPYYATRSGDEHITVDPEARDPLTAERRLFSFVAGAEYVLRLLARSDAPENEKERRSEDFRLENSVFVKSYTYRAWSEEPLPGDVIKKRDTGRDRFGVGDMFRIYVVDWMALKVSYEYATRLPTPDELFGDAVLVSANLDLEPEVSHNANIGPRAELKRPKLGTLVFDVNAFLRDTDKQIVMLGDDRHFTYQNVYRARSLGIEGAAQWTSPGRYVDLNMSLTYQDLRNQSSQGTFADFKGDRLPNRPWLFGAWGGQLRFANLLMKGDELEPFYLGRFTYEFYRGWESVGLKQFKQTVDTQVSHNLGITYGLKIGEGRINATIECQNLTDSKLYDFYGVQRAGRGFYGKITGSI